jgi:succinate dehydrogenase / fumarate reductase cytochrome b subunit
MADASPGSRPRPLSPHVQVWRWHVTMAASILHRVTGVGLYIGALILMAWALSLAAGPGAYGAFAYLAGSILGKLVLVGLTLCVFYHLANGVRHLAWDAGYGFEPRTADATAWLAFSFALVATVLLWGVILATGGAA